MNIISFFTSKVFLRHLALAFILGIVLIFLIIQGLDAYTRNGEVIIVPSLFGKNTDSLVEYSDNDYLQYIVADSLYDSKLKPGTVAFQHPTAAAKVKTGRKIYLSIVAKMPEMVTMPNLLDLSVRRAIDVLKFSHLEVERIVFEDDMALNAIIGQKYRNRSIAQGEELPSGSLITIVAGNGLNNNGVPVPYLLGKNVADAKESIQKSSFNIGSLDTLIREENATYIVYDQVPASNPENPPMLLPGSYISLKITINRGFNYDSLPFYFRAVDSIQIDSSALEEEEEFEF